METTETTIYLLKFALFCIAGGIIFVVLYFCYQAYKDARNAKELRFDVMHTNLDSLIDSYPVNKTSMLKLMSHFKDIRGVARSSAQWEKIEVLHVRFCERYKNVGRELLKEADEFAIQDGDLDERSMKRFE